MYCSIVNPLKFSLASFGTFEPVKYFPFSGGPSFFMNWISLKSQLLSAMEHLQIIIYLRCSFQWQMKMAWTLMLALFPKEKGCICFISDVPHLIKSARNCLSNSGSNLWRHVVVAITTLQLHSSKSELRFCAS